MTDRPTSPPSGTPPARTLRRLILPANFLLCFSLSFLLSQRGQPGGDVRESTGASPASSPLPADRPPVRQRTARAENPQDALYLAAYEKILRSDYNTTSKLALKNEWLKRWLAADPRSALDFYYRHRQVLPEQWPTVLEYHRTHGDQVLNSLLAGDFGFQSRWVALDLFNPSSKLDQARVIDFVKLTGSETRRVALAYLARDAGASPQSAEATVKLFTGFDSATRVDAFAMLGDELKRKNPAALKDLLLGGQLDPASPEYAALAEHYSRAIYQLPVADILKAVGEFPAAAQDNLAKQALHIAEADAMANAETLLAATDVLLQAGKYDVAEQWIKDGSMRHLDSVRLSEWALALPQDSQHEKLFQSAVSGYLSEDPSHGQDWVKSLADGWQKDRAMRQLATVTSGNPKYAEIHQWAAGQAGQ